MLKFIISLFFVLHGLVHLLYFGQSRRLFELQPEMTWPDNSWIFSRFLPVKTTRILACLLCILAATGFITGSYGLLMNTGWWKMVIMTTAVFSSLLFLLLWDGETRKLPDKGGIGVLVIVSIIILMLLFV
jgi:hypothetical protein